jgi:3-hydroxyacyl-CoA dehydrogenase/enoyl-CoA hydratase/3-hydroxybutyryl-CoA epimerase
MDGDLGAVLGVGFPSYLGGPFSAMDTLGLASVVSECDRLSQAYGPLYAIPNFVRDMAASGQSFFGPNAAQPPERLQGELL